MFDFFRKRREFREDRENVFRLLDGYPEYVPPHQGNLDSDIYWTRAQAEENFTFFLGEKGKRIGYLRDYVKNFGINLRFTDEGLKEFSLWFHRYNGHFQYELVENKITNVYPWFLFNPEWQDGLRYLNLIFDISTYIGKYIVYFNPDSDWKLKIGRNTKGNNEDRNFFREYISNKNHLKIGIIRDFYPRNWVDAACMERYGFNYYKKNTNDRWSFWNDPTSLHRFVRCFANPSSNLVDPWYPDGDIAPMKFPASGPSKEQQKFLDRVMADENRYWAAKDAEALRNAGDAK